MLLPMFISFLAISVAIGITFGVIGCLTLKHIRSLNRNGTHETFFIGLVGLAAYSFGDYVKYSGVCSIIVVAMIMRNYGWYSLSLEGRAATKVTFKMLGYLSEVIIFGMIGMGFWQPDNNTWSW